MTRGGVPVRMGVAHGSFKPLRFKTDLARDITLHSSYFEDADLASHPTSQTIGQR